METKIFYLHSYDVDEPSEEVYTDEFVDPEKVKNHPKVQEVTLEYFIDRLNADDIDTQGYFAYEEVK